jgi:hypothetical protein
MHYLYNIVEEGHSEDEKHSRQNEFVEWLREKGIYHEMISTHDMKVMHGMYWLMKEDKG